MQGPLIMEGMLEGQPVVALTFDPAVSGLEKSLAFPLLISNATSFLLSQAEMARARRPAHPRVSRLTPTESDIAPRPLPTFETTNPSASSNPNVGDSAANGANERWPWLAAAALLLLGVEWLVFARRG